MSVVKELHTFVSLYGAEKANKGAMEVSVTEWFKRSDPMLVVDVLDEIRKEPVLFYVSYPSSDPTFLVELIFTAEHIYRPAINKITGRLGELTYARVVTVSLSELQSFEQLIPGLGQDLALDLNCMFWRIENNPKELNVPVE